MAYSLRIADGTIEIEYTAQCSRDGRPVYRWTLSLDSGLTWSDTDLYGPACGREPEEDEMLGTFLSFIGAALESRSYRERTGAGGYDPADATNESLFPADLLDWAESHEAEIAMAGCANES
jgi:hypothetical protein